MVIQEVLRRDLRADVDSQVVTLQGSGADVLLIAADAEIRRPGDPQVLRYRLEGGALPHRNVSQSVAAVMKPAGLEKSKGLITAGTILVDVDNSRWEGRSRPPAVEGFHLEIHVRD